MAGAEGAGSDAATRAEEKPSLNITSISPTKELRSPLTSDGNGELGGHWRCNGKALTRVQLSAVSDWDAVEAMMEAAYRERLLVRSEDHPVLMTQPIHSDRKQRERWSEILMEKFGAPALFFSTDAVLIWCVMCMLRAYACVCLLVTVPLLPQLCEWAHKWPHGRLRLRRHARCARARWLRPEARSVLQHSSATTQCGVMQR